MTSAPLAQQIQLLDVAELDVRAARLAHSKRTLPQLAALAGLASREAELRDDLVRARTTSSDVARELARADDAVRQVRERADRNRARLEGGASPRDAEALTKDLEALARRQDELEEDQLEIMERAEAAAQAAASLEAAAQAAAAERAELVAARDAAAAAIDTEGRAVLARRATAVMGLDADLVALYDDLRRRTGRGAAALQGTTCGACRNQLSVTEMERVRAAPADAVVRCEECERILVRVPEQPAGGIA